MTQLPGGLVAMAQDECGLKKQRSKSKQDFLAIKTCCWKRRRKKRKVHLNIVWKAAVSEATQVVLKTAIVRGKKLLPTKMLMAKK